MQAKTFTRENQNISEASKVFAKAFADDPLIMYLFPNATTTLRESIFYYRLKQGLRDGILFNAQDKGFAMLSNGTRAVVDYAAMSIIPHLVRALPKLLRFQRLCVETNRLAPKNRLILGPVGIDPTMQGRGLASKVIRRALAEAQHQDRPCFCRTYVEKHVSIFEHFGFKVVDVRDIDGLRCWSLLTETE